MEDHNSFKQQLLQQYQELLLKMKEHLEKKFCHRAGLEFIDMNPYEPGLAFTDGCFTYNSDCKDAQLLNSLMKKLMAEKRKMLKNLQTFSSFAG